MKKKEVFVYSTEMKTLVRIVNLCDSGEGIGEHSVGGERKRERGE